jgi:hypothetical protein
VFNNYNINIINFVYATVKEIRDISRLKNYNFPRKSNISAIIYEIAFAISAAIRFFDSIKIDARQFMNNALRVNNLIDEIKREASNI